MTLALRVAGVGAGYGRTQVLHDVSFEVPERSITAVVGPSGCGKSTLLRVVAGLEPLRAGSIEVAAPGGGMITVAGPEIFVAPERRSVGLVPQDGALFEHLSVAGNIGFGMGAWWRPRPARSARVDELIDLIGLHGMGRRRPGSLSGGQRQRVALARSLAPRPAIICLDEPFSALDAQLRVRLRSEVREAIIADRGTALLVTHDREEAMAVADVIVVLLDGRARQIGTPRQIYAEPADAEVARLFGEITVLEADAHGAANAESVLGTVELRAPATGAGGLLIRPGDLEVVRRSGPIVDLQVDSGAGVAGVVRSTEFRGEDVVVVVDVERRGLGLIARAPAESPVAVGDDVWCRPRGPLHFVSDLPNPPGV